MIGNFEAIITYSEYVFYPEISWSANGSQAFLAIPSADPLSPDAYTGLWSTGTTGTALNNGRFDNTNFLAEVKWSPNGRYAATTFAQTADDGQRVEYIVLGDGQGNNNQAITDSAQIAQTMAWNSAETHLIYNIQVALSNNQLYIHNVADNSAVRLDFPSNQIPLNVQWVTPQDFIVATISPAQELVMYSGRNDGSLQPLTATTAPGFYDFQVWTP